MSGWPALKMEAWKACEAPRMTFEVAGERETAMSQVMVTAAMADLVGSALLVAVIWMAVTEGRSAGAL